MKRSLSSRGRIRHTVEKIVLPADAPSMPGALRFLVVLMVVLALWSGTRFGAALYFWNVLQEHAMRGGPLYLALSGAFWLVGALTVLGGIWGRRRWAWWGALSLGSGYFVWYWLDRLVVQLPRANGMFALVFSLLLLALTLGAAFRPATRSFFREGES